ncbi:cytochrome o ubiquinol oxidase, subunit IV [delta proteobacterium NaphS2]|nr:cytochrome o ubiquinol oxidase, subunit IV [delta proteobacterium NaphS2]
MASASMDSSGAGRGSLRTYISGFVLSVVLTVIPFALVMGGGVPRSVVIWGICGAGIVQIFIHLHYFLHLDTSSAARWNVMALVFTLLIIFIFVGGTVWVMVTLNSRMMW